MCASWVHDTQLIIDKLESSRIAKATDEISFHGFRFQELVTLIHSCTKFAEDIPEIEQRRIIGSGIFEAARQGVLTPTSLLRQLNIAEQSYTDKTPLKYTLFTSISTEYSKHLHKRRLNDTTITFNSSPPQHLDRTDVMESAKAHIVGDLPHDYVNVWLSLRARSPHEAGERGLNVLDYLRGVWNWSINRRRPMRSSSGRMQPVNFILLGPLHTLHENNGKVISDVFWYEPDYTGPLSFMSQHSIDWQVILQEENYIRKIISQHPYSEVIRSGFIKYGRALDNRDLNVAFIKLWAVLEDLTDTVKTSNEIAVRRTAFLYEEREFHHQVLRHLANYRNITVHTGRETILIETLLYQLKGYIEDLLRFHIKNKFNTVKDAAAFLDLPFDVEVLKQRMRLWSRAYKFRQPRRDP